jgi:hypothetical protein
MKKYLTFVIIGLFSLTQYSICQSGDIQLPKGWRLPTATETNDDWREKDVNRYLLVKADFNGDGIKDEANLLVNDNGDKFALFAFLSQNGSEFKTFQLTDHREIAYIKVMGIEVVQPGKYKTACGKGFVDCGKGDSEEIILLNAGINYFKKESASMYFFWDKSNQSFKGVGIED